MKVNHAFNNPEAKLKDFIQIYDDYIDSDLWDLILTEYTLDDPDWSASTVSLGYENKVSTNFTSRNSLELALSEFSVINKNLKTRQQIDEKLFTVCNSVWNDYVSRVAPWIKTRHDSGYQLLSYGVGCYFKEHTDSLYYPEIQQDNYIHIDHCVQRQISISIQLNENYVGGELSFFNGTYSIPKKKGLITVFPSYNLFPHQVSKVTEGRRFSIVTWFL